MKKILLLVTLLFSFVFSINASTTIDVTKKLNGVDDISNTFYYNVSAKDTNPDVVNDFTSSFSIDVNNNDITGNTAIKTYTLDFGNVSFNKLGRYEFILSESSSLNEEVYPVDTNTYTIIVNVVNELNSDNEPTGNKIIDVLSQAYYNGGSGKSDIVFETNPLTYITISKKVTGDLADMTEYFKFKIDIDEGTNYIINGQDEVVNYNGQVINTSNIYDESTDNYIYLKHGQSVTIGIDNDNKMQLPSNTMYTVEEMDAQNYQTHINNSKSNSKSIFMTTINTPEKNNLSYENNYESNVLTGLFVNNMPFIILIAISLIGFIIIRKKAVK